MASLIHGYEYDIFISYRQKDNKGDRWVSRFVDALKTELEATFKEDVSVYFDENPHDRLLETHNVNKSLEGKLKCLIFIPILSQTYCDPASYAWQNEFLAFLRMAETDRFGKDIRLRSGNVASRILPIRIHDLESEDVKLFEKETGSVLRALEFVFRTATGVSRPLLAIEDHPNDNLNKIFYRDQLNKVASAIKEIILGMKREPDQVVIEKSADKEPAKEVKKGLKPEEKENPVRFSKRKLLTGFTVLVILIIIGAILAYPKIFKRDTIEKLRSSGERISVAVMPFQNMSNDTSWNVWQCGIQNELINNLTNSEDLKVRQTESINSLIQSNGLTNYASITPSVAGTVSRKLEADVFVYGSIKQTGTTLRVNAQLIDSKTKEPFKSFQIDGPAENILYIIDSLSTAVNDFLIISRLKKGATFYSRNIPSTDSPEAYRLYMYGQEAFSKKDYPSAVKLYTQAIYKDSNFIMAINQLAFAYGNQFLYDQAKAWSLKSYRKIDQMPTRLKITTNWTYSRFFETPYEGIKYLRQILEIDDQAANSFTNLGYMYNELYEYEKAIPEFEKALEIFKKWNSKPMWVYNYIHLGDAYHKTGQYKKEKNLYKRAEKDFPGDLELIHRQAILSLSEGDTIAANGYIGKLRIILKENSASEADIESVLADVYSGAGILNKAEQHFRKALSLEPGNPYWINTLAWFLIDKGQNVNEGLELADKALVFSPEASNYLDTKGWGLYKSGKYKEALRLLEKSWELKPVYNHEIYLHLEAAKKAVAGLKTN